MSNKITDAQAIDNLVNQKWQVRTMENSKFIQSPLSAYTSWYLSQRGTRCDFFEKQWLECASNVGYNSGVRDKCKDEFEDLNECTRKLKTFKRYMRMQEERQKNGIVYQNPPPVDTHPYLKFKSAHY